MDRLEIVEADITTLDVDAIVNAANTSLLEVEELMELFTELPGKELLAECRCERCRTGKQKLQKGII